MAFGVYQPQQYYPQQQYYQQQYPYYPTAMPDQLSQLRSGAQQQPIQQTQGNSGVIWVQGEAGAKSYLVANGSSVLLMDSESKTFYIKSADASGMPSMHVYDYEERVTPTKPVPPVAQADEKQFATREELESISKRLEQLENKKRKVVNPDESNGQ